MTLAEHGEGITRHMRENLGKGDVLYASGKIFMILCLEQVCSHSGNSCTLSVKME